MIETKINFNNFGFNDWKASESTSGRHFYVPCQIQKITIVTSFELFLDSYRSFYNFILVKLRDDLQSDQKRVKVFHWLNIIIYLIFIFNAFTFHFISISFWLMVILPHVTFHCVFQKRSTKFQKFLILKRKDFVLVDLALCFLHKKATCFLWLRQYKFTPFCVYTAWIVYSLLFCYLFKNELMPWILKKLEK